MYLLDANVFKEARNRYYSFRICPGFWQWLEQANATGTVSSIEEVRKEVDAGDKDDDLRVWFANEGTFTFMVSDEHTAEALKQVVQWVMAQDYDDKNRALFLKTDSVLIAHAMAHSHTVVTQETYVPANSRKVKIPNVCRAMGVVCMNTFAMLEQENASFILKAGASVP